VTPLSRGRSWKVKQVQRLPLDRDLQSADRYLVVRSLGGKSRGSGREATQDHRRWDWKLSIFSSEREGMAEHRGSGAERHIEAVGIDGGPCPSQYRPLWISTRCGPYSGLDVLDCAGSLDLGILKGHSRCGNPDKSRVELVLH
jgi:hypothetical protein